MPICHHCGKKLSSNQRLKTHISAVHDTSYAHTMKGSDYDVNSEHMDTFSQQSGQTEDIFHDQLSTASDSESEMDEDHDDEEVWLWVMQKVMGETGRPDLIKPDGSAYDSKKLLRAIRDEVKQFVNMMEHLTETRVFSEIEKEKDRLTERGYDDDEATNAAWKNRQYLIKKEVVKPFIEHMQSLDSENEDEEEEEEEEEKEES